MKIYVSGPYSAEDPREVERNVERAIDAAIEVLRRGHMPVCPHLSHYLDRRARERGYVIPWEVWIRMDLQIIQECDALLYLGASRGADIERAFAEGAGKRIFQTLFEVPDVRELRGGTNDRRG